MTTTTADPPPAAVAAPTAEPPPPATFPRLDEGRARVDAPPTKVVLLEDRAQVRREGTAALVAGTNRLVVVGVAPVLQDVSLRGEVVEGAARVADARVRRTLKVGAVERPEHVAAIEEELRALERRFLEIADEKSRADARYGLVVDMMRKAGAEVPEDAAWSLGHQQLWREAFESLGGRARKLLQESLARAFDAADVSEQAGKLIERRRAVDRPDVAMLAVVELDVVADREGGAQLALEYSVPNALWRPFHSAELVEPAAGQKQLRFATSAAVWQNTGEDWTDVELSFSTARSSLGVEPPRLRDDPLAAKKKSESVVVATREVAVQKAGLGREAAVSAASEPRAVELPGVDDGGEIRVLRARARTTVPSDGRPALVPVASFTAEAEHQLVAVPELDERVFHRCRAVHRGAAPILAGPVELVRTSGFVGFTRTLYVAPGERLELGFGPDDDLRVRRVVDEESEVDSVDQWTKRTFTTTVYLSNLAGAGKLVEVVERVPVSEIEHVRVTVVADKTSGAPAIDADGFVRWNVELAPYGRMKLFLVHRVEYAPGVRAG